MPTKIIVPKAGVDYVVKVFAEWSVRVTPKQITPYPFEAFLIETESNLTTVQAFDIGMSVGYLYANSLKK